jgi:hypothetical protein
MRMTAIGTALAAALLATGALAQQAPEPQTQMRAPGTGTANPPAQETHPGPTGPKMSGPQQSPVVKDQQTAPGTGTAKAPGQKTKTQTTGSAVKRATPPAAPGNRNMDRGTAPGTGTATAPSH